MRKLGVSLVAHKEVGAAEQIGMIKAAGFACFFFNYKDDTDIDLIKKTADQVGLEIETAHLPFGGANRLWEEGDAGEDYLQSLCDKISGCQRIGVDKAIVHVTIATVAPPVSEIGKERFMRLCDHAQKCGVQLAFENLEPHPHLQVIMDLIPDFHGFCWDCGHNLCYTPTVDMMSLYGERLICTHIHDNCGITRPGDIHYRDDLHLLPFDGNLDWEWVAEKFRNANFEGPLTLELGLKGKAEYGEMPLQEFFNDAYRRVQKLLLMVNRI